MYEYRVLKTFLSKWNSLSPFNSHTSNIVIRDMLGGMCWSKGKSIITPMRNLSVFSRYHILRGARAAGVKLTLKRSMNYYLFLERILIVFCIRRFDQEQCIDRYYSSIRQLQYGRSSLFPGGFRSYLSGWEWKSSWVPIHQIGWAWILLSWHHFDPHLR